MFLEILIVLMALIKYIHHQMTRHNDYWTKHGIPHVPNQFPLGSSIFTAKSVISGKVYRSCVRTVRQNYRQSQSLFLQEQNLFSLA